MFNQSSLTNIKNSIKHYSAVFIYLLLTVFITTTSVFCAAGAEQLSLPIELEAKLFLTALTYDRNLKKNVTEQLNIGLLYFPDEPCSESQASDFAGALEKFKDKKVSGLGFEKVLLDYKGAGNLKDKITLGNINVLYIASGKIDVIRDVTKITREAKVFTFTSSAEYVIECGVSMAIVFQESKPKIFLNFSSAKAEGADFAAKFLRIVKLVDQQD